MLYPPEIELEETHCPLGCPEDDDQVLIGRDRLHNLPGRFVVVRCRTCGLMRTNPRPTPETIGFYYPDDYGPYLGTRVNLSQSSNPSHARPFCKRVARQMVEFNTTRLPFLPVGRMLEIGCASGTFLHKMSKEGWDVEGIEFSEKAAESARSLGYSVQTGSLETAAEPKQEYDLVVGWMVLEHLHDPILALQKLHRWTKPGGWLVLSVPNANSLEFRLFRDYWYALQVPTHLYHYTPRTIKALLKQGGWGMERIFHQRVLSNLAVSLGYVLQDRTKLTRLAERLIKFPEKAGRQNYFLYPFACLLSAFGQTGRMTIWARRLE